MFFFFIHCIYIYIHASFCIGFNLEGMATNQLILKRCSIVVFMFQSTPCFFRGVYVCSELHKVTGVDYIILQSYYIPREKKRDIRSKSLHFNFQAKDLTSKPSQKLPKTNKNRPNLKKHVFQKCPSTLWPCSPSHFAEFVPFGALCISHSLEFQALSDEVTVVLFA